MKPYYEQDGITIYHGEALDVLHDLQGVDALITDPPYSSGGQYRGDRTMSTVAKYVQSGTLAYRPEFAGDNRDQRSYLAWCSLWMTAARHATSPGAVVVCFTDWRQLPTTTDAVQAGGWTWRGVAVWSKKFGRVSAFGFSSACEYLVWGTNGPAAKNEEYPGGCFECVPPRGDAKKHIAQKPLDVMRWACSVAPPGGVVLDPFMGSGTTLRAALDTGRAAIGVEIEERYCEIAATRLAQTVLAYESKAAPKPKKC